jgi:hypothetical protein
MTLPTITTRTAKGSALSFAEMDTNFQNLANVTVPITVKDKTGATAGVVSTTAAAGYTLQAASGGNVNLAVAGNVITISSLAGSGGGGSDTFNNGDVTGLGPVTIIADELYLTGGVVAMGSYSLANAVIASTTASGGDAAVTTGAMATVLSQEPGYAYPAATVAGVVVPDTTTAFQSNAAYTGFNIAQQAGWGNVYIPVTNGTASTYYQFSNVGLKFTDNTVQTTSALALTGGTMSGNIAMGNRWLSNVAAVRYNDGTTDSTASLPLTGGSVTGNVEFNNNYVTNAVLGTTIEKTANIGVVLGTVTVNANTGPIQTAVVSGNITINTNNMTNFNTGESVTLVLTQATNANTRILTSNLKYAGASKTLSTANAAIDTISITYDGTNYLAALVKGYA